MPPLRARLLELLSASGLPFQVLEHAPAGEAREAAIARGTPLEIGGKTALFKLDRLGFALVVIGSDRRLESRPFRHALGVQRYRFATVEELLSFGLRPGEVPAFGRPLLEAELFVGQDVLSREEIAFAAASDATSVRMRVRDWLALARPRVVPTYTTLA